MATTVEWLCYLFFLFLGARATNLNAHFCVDLEPQQRISITELMGMWYGIEIIYHTDDIPSDIEYSAECPVIYFFDDSTKERPYENVKYGQTYGTPMRGTTYQASYGQHQDPDPYPRATPDYYSSVPSKTELHFKRLRMWWVEYENGVEYRLKYNETKPGLWISSGPHNGSSLEPQFNHFAGTVMVLKVVGSHMVLTFCYRMPDKRLFTVILGREHNLTSVNIYDIHGILIKKGLDIVRSRKVCQMNGSGGLERNAGLVVGGCVVLLCKYMAFS